MSDLDLDAIKLRADSTVTLGASSWPGGKPVNIEDTKRQCATIGDVQDLIAEVERLREEKVIHKANSRAFWRRNLRRLTEVAKLQAEVERLRAALIKSRALEELAMAALKQSKQGTAGHEN